MNYLNGFANNEGPAFQDKANNTEMKKKN